MDDKPVRKWQEDPNQTREAEIQASASKARQRLFAHELQNILPTEIRGIDQQTVDAIRDKIKGLLSGTELDRLSQGQLEFLRAYARVAGSLQKADPSFKISQTLLGGAIYAIQILSRKKDGDEIIVQQLSSIAMIGDISSATIGDIASKIKILLQQPQKEGVNNDNDQPRPDEPKPTLIVAQSQEQKINSLLQLQKFYEARRFANQFLQTEPNIRLKKTSLFIAAKALVLFILHDKDSSIKIRLSEKERTLEYLKLFIQIATEPKYQDACKQIEVLIKQLTNVNEEMLTRMDESKK